MQSDLFELPPLAGLAQEEGIVAPREEHALIASIDAAELSPFRFHGWSGKRLTASYGWSYDFDTAQFSPTEPIPAWLLPLRVKAARFAHIAAEDLVQALLIRYDAGAGIGWHCDRPIPQAQGWRLRSRLRRVGSPIDLPSERRSAAPVGAQHRGDGGDALVDHLPQPDAERTRVRV